MPEFFSAINAYQPAPFTPFNWNSTVTGYAYTYASILRWRIDTNNAASYPGTGTTITSIDPFSNGSRTFTVQGGPSFVTSGDIKYFAFDGVNDAFYSNFNDSLFFNENRVMGFWVWHDTAAVNIKRTLFSIWDASNDLFDITINTSASGYGINLYINTEGPATHPITTILPNTWNFIAVFRGGNSGTSPYVNTYSVYLNGSWVTTVSNTTATSVLGERWVLGANNGSGTAATASWMPARIPEAFYTENSIGNNFNDFNAYVSGIYNGTKGRYGL
jgi:hypothetical protein